MELIQHLQHLVKSPGPPLPPPPPQPGVVTPGTVFREQGNKPQSSTSHRPGAQIILKVLAQEHGVNTLSAVFRPYSVNILHRSPSKGKESLCFSTLVEYLGCFPLLSTLGTFQLDPSLPQLLPLSVRRRKEQKQQHPVIVRKCFVESPLVSLVGMPGCPSIAQNLNRLQPQSIDPDRAQPRFRTDSKRVLTSKHSSAQL